MSFFSTHDPQNPLQTANNQRGFNLDAAANTRRFTDMDQVTPWGAVTHSGTPGMPGYTRTETLNPWEQIALDESRVGRNLSLIHI